MLYEKTKNSLIYKAGTERIDNVHKLKYNVGEIIDAVLDEQTQYILNNLLSIELYLVVLALSK